VIERMHALDLIAQRDREDALFYVDPPYMWETRSTKVLGASRWHAYQHELTDADHEALLTQLLAVKGMVVLSGYATLLYDDMLAGWRRIEKQTHADGARPRTEILWINPAAAAARCAGPLFAEAS
jgi:DNA adenine methylase